VQAGKRAAAEVDGTNGAEGLVVGEADEAAGRGLFDGHFGNDGNAHASADHAEKAAELATFKNDLRIKPGAVAGGDGGVAKTVAIAEEEEGLGAEILEEERRALGESMMLGNGGEKAFGEEWRGFKFMAADRKREDGDIYVAGAKAFKKDGGDFLHNRKMRLRKFAGKGDELCGQEVRRNGRDDAKAKRAADGVFELGDVAASGLNFAKNRTGAGEKRFPELRETNGTPQPVKEAGAEFVFELAYLLRERGLRDVGLLGAAAEAAGIGHGAEVPELVNFHRARLGNQPPVSKDQETVFGTIGNAYLLYPN
jgi:hypothetical protein